MEVFESTTIECSYASEQYLQNRKGLSLFVCLFVCLFDLGFGILSLHTSMVFIDIVHKTLTEVIKPDKKKTLLCFTLFSIQVLFTVFNQEWFLIMNVVS